LSVCHSSSLPISGRGAAGSAVALGASGRRFDFCRPDHTRATQGDADRSLVETGRKNWASPELVTGHHWSIGREVQGSGSLSRGRASGSFVRIEHAPPDRGGCSSTGRAPALQAGGCRFDADRLHHRFVRSVSSVARALPCLGRLSGIRLPHGAPLFAEVAHQVEQLIEDQRVEGSSPSFGTIITGRLAERPIAPGLNPGIEASPRSRVRIPRLPPSSFFGEVPEWSIGARWKRDGRSDAARGSNPRFSSTPFWICARAVKGL
jgi:hypothetical protein